MYVLLHYFRFVFLLEIKATKIESNPNPRARSQFGLCNNYNIVYIFGGHGQGSKNYFNDFWYIHGMYYMEKYTI